MAQHFASGLQRTLAFDEFQVFPRQRLLLRAGEAVRIGSRAFDLLLILLERPGERIAKAELLSRVWPDTHVVEGNLKFQIAALRRVLRDGEDDRRFIDTSQGQGYSFVAPVVMTEESEDPPVASAPAALRNNLPQQMTPLYGRSDVIARLVRQLEGRHLITIVGPGGIGKTSVALAVAERLIGAYDDGVWVVDLARVTDPGQVPRAVANAVGLDAAPDLGVHQVVSALQGKDLLLVLDNCAHVVDAAASLVSAILRSDPDLHILATSREPLRTEGEYLCRLEPLKTPPPSPSLKAAEALEYPSVGMFVDLAAASLDGFHLTDDDAPTVGDICRKLDGIPLAIELAAARTGVLGISGLAGQLEDRLRVLTGGRRTAVPQHRTMRATLDWSYDLLSEPEQIVFARLGIFTGWFTLADAAAVLADESQSGEDVVQWVLDLTDKSLLAGDLDPPDPRFRLLDTTRAYALQRMKEQHGLDRLGRRHAAYYLQLFEKAFCEDAAGSNRQMSQEMDNLRAALSWAFGQAGDAELGINLIVASVPVWLSTSLLNEARMWIETALGRLNDAGLADTRQEMILLATLGISSQIAQSVTENAYAALTRARGLAERLHEHDGLLHIVNSLWVYHIRIGQVRIALTLAQQAEALARSVSKPASMAEANFMLGAALFFAGDNKAARQHLEPLVKDPPPAYGTFSIRQAGFDQHIAAHTILAHSLWLQGRPRQATELIHAALEHARRLQHPVTLCSSLAWGGCAVALRTGDLAAASGMASELTTLAQRHALSDHLCYGQAVQDIISLRQTGARATRDQADAVLRTWRACQWHAVLNVAEFAEPAARAGYAEEMLELVDEHLAWGEQHEVRWALPEILRVKGELLLMKRVPDTDLAREHFHDALEMARASNALSWELRTAMSIARLELACGDASKARSLVSSVYARFQEGFETADLQDACTLLAKLS